MLDEIASRRTLYAAFERARGSVQVTTQALAELLDNGIERSRSWSSKRSE